MTDPISDDLLGASLVIRAAVVRLPTSGWMTAAEIGSVSAASLTAMCKRTPAWAERRSARWGGEPGQKHGRGYEYGSKKNRVAVTSD